MMEQKEIEDLRNGRRHTKMDKQIVGEMKIEEAKSSMRLKLEEHNRRKKMRADRLMATE
jgi:hypothetical protein